MTETKPDHALFGATLALVVLGAVMVFSSSNAIALRTFGDATSLSLRHILAASLGLAAMFILMKVDYHFYRKPVVVFTGLTVVIGLCVLVFFLPAVRDTHRWIQLPRLSFQPSECAKLALIVFLSYFLESRTKRVNEFSTLAPVSAIVGLLAGLIVLQKDLGTALLLLVTATLLLYVAGLNMKWIGVSTLFAIPLASIAFYFLIFLVPQRWNRILGFLNPQADPHGYGFQIVQSLTAFGNGGIPGLGFMEGKQKLLDLPDAHTDFIFAVIGEELGLVGTCTALLLFGIFLWRGMRASFNSRDLFGFYLAFGITTVVCAQAFINISVVLGMVPNKGIPLPFLSYGGSSLVTTLASVGILLNVSHRARSLDIVPEKSIDRGSYYAAQRREYLLLVGLAGLFIVGLLLYGWQQYQWVQSGYQLGFAQKQKENLEEERRKLLAELDFLKGLKEN